MTDYADRLRKFNRASQLQYEWFEEVADYIEELEGKAMQNDADMIGVETIDEYEYGSATYQFHMDAYDFITNHFRYESE